MAREIKGHAMRRGKVLVLLAALGATVLIIGACGGSSSTATAEGIAQLEPNGLSSPSSESASQPEGQAEGAQVGASMPAAAGETSAPSGLSSLGEIAEVERTSGPLETAVSAAVVPAIQYVPNQQVGIWVTGCGEVTTTPNLAVLSAGVEAMASSVEQARGQAAGAMDGVIATLKARGIQDRDIQTRHFNISPEYTYNELKRQRELVGYRVTNQVSVKIRDMDSVGIVIDEVAEAAGDLVRIQGIRFTVEDTKVLESQARIEAVQDLMSKARQFAELTGVQLGNPTFLSEGGGAVPRVQNLAVRALAEAAPAPPTSISGGELTVTITVQGAFSIVQ